MGELNEYEINWRALKSVLESDIRIYNELAANVEHGPAGNAARADYLAQAKQAGKTLGSMSIIENTAVAS